MIQLVQAAAVLVPFFLLYKVGFNRLKKYLEQEEGSLAPGVKATVYQILKSVCGYGLIFGALVFILRIFEIELIGPEQLRQAGISLVKVLGVLFLARLALSLGRTFISHLEDKENADSIAGLRRRTLKSLLMSLFVYGVYFLAAVMILENLGIRTVSLLAGVGVLGLAVSFGAQNLVKDIISGFFIVFEGQFNIGEYVEIAGVKGTVEEFGLRATKIREWTGQLHIIPNGEISKVSNYSRGKMKAVVTVGIAYEEDIDRALEVLKEAAAAALNEIKAIVEEPVVQGVSELGDSHVGIQAVFATLPGEQWAVEREMRKRFVQALGAAGIEIPYPRRVIINKEEEGEK